MDLAHRRSKWRKRAPDRLASDFKPQTPDRLRRPLSSNNKCDPTGRVSDLGSGSPPALDGASSQLVCFLYNANVEQLGAGQFIALVEIEPINHCSTINSSAQKNAWNDGPCPERRFRPPLGFGFAAHCVHSAMSFCQPCLVPLKLRPAAASSQAADSHTVIHLRSNQQ
jgi:hypothetical protein